MFTVNVKITEKNPGAYKALKKRLEQISRKRVVAGFPKGKLNNPHYEPEDGKPGPSIIDVAIWNNFGIGVPRREFMNPASQEWQKYFQQMVEASSQEIANGEIDIDNFLNLMGQAGAEFISEAIVKLRRPPNALATIERKKSSNPLVDSGDLSKAPVYEIRIKNK
jgi:hypothetical protein